MGLNKLAAVLSNQAKETPSIDIAYNRFYLVCTMLKIVEKATLFL